jgi:hypothetical protein
MIDLKSSILCTSRLNCKDCRNKEGGRYWRLTLAQVYRLPEDKVDFECPHGKPWGFVEKNSEMPKRGQSKEETIDGETDEERRYTLTPDIREKLREIFLQFRTACYKHRTLHDCTCELQTMGGCGLKSVLKTQGRLSCAEGHFPAIENDEDFRRQLNKCEEKD